MTDTNRRSGWRLKGYVNQFDITRRENKETCKLFWNKMTSHTLQLEGLGKRKMSLCFLISSCIASFPCILNLVCHIRWETWYMLRKVNTARWKTCFILLFGCYGPGLDWPTAFEYQQLSQLISIQPSLGRIS